MRHLALVAALLAVLLLEPTSGQRSIGCPAKCKCSERKVDCKSQGLVKIPQFPVDTLVIDLSSNNLRHIKPNAFDGLHDLHTIVLTQNQLSSVAANVFDDLPSLRNLHLDENRIAKIEPGAFKRLERLQNLYLQQNDIFDVEPGTLANLLRLERLYLNDNKITRLAEGTFEHLTNLKYLRLYQNPIDCDCTILWMTKWLAKAKLQETAVACLYPAELAGRNVEKLDADNLNCKRPTIDEQPSEVAVGDGQSGILPCRVNGQPQPDVTWVHNSTPLPKDDPRFEVLADGSLRIFRADSSYVGQYECRANNSVGVAVASRQVRMIRDTHRGAQIAEAVTATPGRPRLTLRPPSNLEVNTGEAASLWCGAEDAPAKSIQWQHNGFPVDEFQIVRDQKSAMITFDEIYSDDEGKYTCKASNEFGSTEQEISVVVIDTGSAPEMLIEPEDLVDALPGTTIEMPCLGEGEPKPVVTWRKDGRKILETAKHRISSSGSLHIMKIDGSDAGRYECSLINKHGRSTGSALLTVKITDVLFPGDRYVRIAYAEASNEIDAAINQTISTLFGGNGETKRNHHGHDLFTLFRYPNENTRELARAAEIYERTLTNIRRHVDRGAMLTHNTTHFEYNDILSPDKLNLVAELSGCQAHRVVPNCTHMCFHLKYRTIDGTCNNFGHSVWGASLTGFRRVLPPIYENGFSMPIGFTKGKLYHGFPKPSARHVSTQVISTKVITQDEQITHMVMQWGQFLDHDLDHAIPSVSSESWDGIDCKKSCEYAPPCYPIEVPPNDPRIKNRRCIDLVRSSAICGSGMTSVFFGKMQPREQINQLTAYIDASQVYGYTTQFARELRDLSNENGLLRVGVSFPNQKPLLPFAAPQDGIDCRRNVEEANVNCFVAGDIRANEQIGLTAMHTLWMREHNRLAGAIKRMNKHWDGETVYQEARKIVGAQMQHITYKHWLPNVLGPKGMQLLGDYKGYDATVNPGISNEFATAALRFGHTLINPLLHRLNETFEPIPQGHLMLHKAFFAPWRLAYEGGLDPLMRGMYSVPAKLKKPKENLNDELTEKLFLTSHAVALDLAAINIQRAREHAIPGYNEFRQVCNLSRAETFDDLRHEITDAKVRAKLQQLYGHPSNIDLFVGGILEDQIEGARVGPLFRCLLIEQFRRLRDGDRLWYENAATFRPEQLDQIKSASLASVLCNNGDNITRITDNVFHLPSVQQGGLKPCGEIAQINLNVWLNCDKCNAIGSVDPNHPPPFDPNMPPSLVTRQRRSLSEADTPLNATITSSAASFMDMTETFGASPIDKRIKELEQLVDSFEATMQQMRKRLAKLEASCGKSNKDHGGH